jgi:uncharacterized protein
MSVLSAARAPTSGCMRVPDSVARFLACRRIAVAGVSRAGDLPANAIFRRLRDTGHDVVPINPSAVEVEGTRCYPDLLALPEPVEALMIAAHPDVAADLVRQAAATGVRHIWFHRSVGHGSVSEAAVRECAALHIRPIVGGCPMMYAGKVDIAHHCFRWLFSPRHATA